VARGRIAGYLEKGVTGHDIVAAEVIVNEAGGKVTGFDGKTLDYSKPFNGAVLTNGIVHHEILDLLT
jgi:myo-inositol-1(or 4)-monophosphatase